MTEPIININDYESKADSYRKDVLPKIYASDWTNEQIIEQRTFTDGKIVDAFEKLTQLTNNQIELNKKFEFLVPAILEYVFQFAAIEI